MVCCGYVTRTQIQSERNTPYTYTYCHKNMVEHCLLFEQMRALYRHLIFIFMQICI